MKKRSYFQKGHLRFMGDNNCAYCGVEFKGENATPHLDHVIPKALNGSDHHSNLLLVCQWCNLHKNSKRLETVRPVLIQKKIGWPQFNADQIAWLRKAGFDTSPFDNGKFWFEDRQACAERWIPNKKTKFYDPDINKINWSSILSFGS